MINLLRLSKFKNEVKVMTNTAPYFIITGNRKITKIFLNHFDEVIGVLKLGKATRANRFMLLYGPKDEALEKIKKLGIPTPNEHSGFIVDNEVRPSIKSTTLFSYRLCYYIIENDVVVMVCAERV